MGRDAVVVGNALEQAVQLIEQMILRSNPATKDAVITIEPKKHIVVDGVLHEIDVFITIDYGRGYKAVFIFECKNWQDTVGKDQIAVFSDKINAAQAQTGYFIAKKFSKYAKARAKLDKRIELLNASSEVGEIPRAFYNHLHFLVNETTQEDIKIGLNTSDESYQVERPISGETLVNYLGKDMPLDEFRKQLRDDTVNEIMNHTPTGTMNPGVYPFEHTKQFSYEPDTLFINGIACRKIVAHMKWNSYILLPRVVSRFDIQTRGRVITLEFDPFQGSAFSFQSMAHVIDVAPPLM